MALAYSNIELSIRRVIVKEVEKRNYREKEPFEVLIATCELMVDILKKKFHLK